MNTGWIACDLDGTLAYYTKWEGATAIGAPIPKMVERVRKWLAQGKDVRILTARAHPDNPAAVDAIPAIKAWCIEHIGQELPITCSKDFLMVELWDDRCVQLVPNTGERVDGKD